MNIITSPPGYCQGMNIITLPPSRVLSGYEYHYFGVPAPCQRGGGLLAALVHLRADASRVLQYQGGGGPGGPRYVPVYQGGGGPGRPGYVPIYQAGGGPGRPGYVPVSE